MDCLFHYSSFRNRLDFHDRDEYHILASEAATEKPSRPTSENLIGQILYVVFSNY